MLLRFVTDGDAEEHDMSSRHLVALKLESPRLSSEAVGQSADVMRGRRRRLTGGLNDKK